MKRTIMFAPVTLLTVFALAAPGEKPEAAAEKKAVAMVIAAYTEALKAEDLEGLMNLFVRDDDLTTVNVHLPGILKGPEQVATAASKWFNAIEEPELAVREQTIKLSATGDTAWASFVLDESHSVPGSSERYSFSGMRVTWGLEKRNGKYLIVQAHWSFVCKG